MMFTEMPSGTAGVLSTRRCLRLVILVMAATVAACSSGADGGARSGAQGTTQSAGSPAAGSPAPSSQSPSSPVQGAPASGAAVDAAAVSIGGNDVIHHLSFINYAEEYTGLSDHERAELAERQRSLYDDISARPAECRDALFNDDYVTGLVADDPAATNFLTWSDPQAGETTGIQRFALLISSVDAIGEHGTFRPACSRFTADLPVGEAGGGHSVTLNYKTIPLDHVDGVEGADHVEAFTSVYWTESEPEADEHSDNASIYIRATKGGTVVEGRGSDLHETARLVSAQLARIP